MNKNVYTKFSCFSFLLLICLFSFCTVSFTQGDADYKLVWSDEFEGTSIDTSYWNFEKGGHGWGNHEQQYYQAANAAIENGNLVITAKKETVGSNKYTSTRITTQGKKEFLYGRIEARIKMPVGQGFWPAFWMLGANINEVDWPESGEIDIMEHINADSLIYGTLHWNNNGHVFKGDTLPSTPAAWHVYRLEWDVSFMKWFVDDKEFYKADITDNAKTEFHKPFYILFNFAIGGDWPGQTVNDRLLPAKMYVDYVRVYQKK